MKKIKMKNLVFILFAATALNSCTKLDEKLNDGLTEIEAKSFSSAAGLLKNTYDQLQKTMVDQGSFWALEEHTSDELVGPTRSSDWDDNGRWRKLHLHTYDKTHDLIGASYEDLLVLQYSATNVLKFTPTPVQKAEARFLRAYSMYCTLIGWGQVAFRSETETAAIPPVKQAAEAMDFIISELTAIVPDLPSRPAALASQANKDAANFLLMKCYLNKGMVVNRATPTFSASDMTQVLTISNNITGYSLATNFFDNFSENNITASTENIFTESNNASTVSRNGNSVRSRWFMTLNYAHSFGGWNGFTTLSDFYNKFETVDKRRSASYPGVTNVTGMKVGFLVGPQFNAAGVQYLDGKGVPLSYTSNINLSETVQPAIEQAGIRVVKYPTTNANKDVPTNDYVFFRYADVLLMKAEATLRTGSMLPALAIINNIRTARGASILPPPLTFADILDERGRELYWEGWRREDQIRFGTFLTPNQLKPGTSTAKYFLFPIPDNDLAANPNLVQNTGF
jgi:starch-binding outer membrane protein, SusD/RagB family